MSVCKTSSHSGSRDLSLKSGLGTKPQASYVYSALPTSTSIRVIEWPQKLVPTTDLRFHLRIIDLLTLDRPSYVSISYCWGTDSGFEAEDVEILSNLLTNTVVCDGHFLRVTENAYTALAEMQWRGRAELFWLDAVCIDQSNLEERGHQVAIMGEIYARAERTIVWLGEDDGAAREAHETVHANFNYSEEAKPTPIIDWFTENIRARLAAGLPQFVELKLSADLSPKLTDVLAFFSRPWFQRLWVIQEVVLAKQLWIVCGGLTFDWQELADFANNTRLEMLLLGFEDDNIVSQGLHGLSVIRMIAFLRGDKSRFQRIASSVFGHTRDPGGFCAAVGTLVGILDTLSASDSRDRVYAPLALASRICSAQPSTFFLPDYSQPAETVFVSTAQYILQETSSLAVFGMSKTAERQSSSTFPSWTPDLRIRSAQKAISTLSSCNATKDWQSNFSAYIGNQDKLNMDLTTCPFEESRSSAMQISKSRALLGTTGVLEGKIAKLSETVLILTEEGNLFALMDVVRDSTTGRMKPYDVPQILFKTLTLGNKPIDNPLKLLEPLDAGFAAWFSIKILSNHYNNRMSWVELLPYIDFLEDGRRNKFCLKHSTIRMPEQFHKPSSCKLCKVRPKSMWIGDWDQLACDKNPEHHLSFRTLLNLSNIINFLMLSYRSGADVLPELVEYWSRAFQFQSACQPYVTDRSLYTDHEGRLGMCPRTSRLNDQIWFLPGAKTPVILRPKKSQSFEFIGEAYLDGYMQGEICRKRGVDELQSLSLE